MTGSDVLSLFQLSVGLNLVFSSYVYFYEKNVERNKQIVFLLEEEINSEIKANKEHKENTPRIKEMLECYQKILETVSSNPFSKSSIIPDIISLIGIMIGFSSCLFLYVFTCFSSETISPVWAIYAVVCCCAPISFAIWISINSIYLNYFLNKSDILLDRK